jgi:hypothetical protein
LAVVPGVDVPDFPEPEAAVAKAFGGAPVRPVEATCVGFQSFLVQTSEGRLEEVCPKPRTL